MTVPPKSSVRCPESDEGSRTGLRCQEWSNWTSRPSRVRVPESLGGSFGFVGGRLSHKNGCWEPGRWCRLLRVGDQDLFKYVLE